MKPNAATTIANLTTSIETSRFYLPLPTLSWVAAETLSDRQANALQLRIAALLEELSEGERWAVRTGDINRRRGNFGEHRGCVYLELCDAEEATDEEVKRGLRALEKATLILSTKGER